MLRSFDGWESEHFSFGAANASATQTSDTGPTAIAIDNGSDGPSATIPDSHLLFTAQFSRAGADLVLTGDDGKAFVVHDYFSSDVRARLLSAEGAALSPDVVAALAGPLTPGQYAQAGAAQPAAQAVGRVVQASGDATIVRNGVAVAAQAGDAILKGDVLQTVTGTFGVTFNDGSTLNLTANSRLVVNEFVYDPKGSANSQLLDLVQGSLTFISGEIAHNGDMKIGTPVATMAIRGTVGGVTNANDGTVNFYVSQSATGAVILDSRGTIIANVVQDGPLIIVRPVGPLQVIAEEVQKSPAQLATELSALQQIVSIQAVGQQIIQQFFQPDPNATPNPNPQSTDKPHMQIQIELQTNPTPLNDPSHNGDNAPPPQQITATVTVITPPTGTGLPPTVDHDPIFVTVAAANVAPILNYFNLTIDHGGITILSASDYHVTDPDSSSFVFSVANVTGGVFQVSHEAPAAETLGFSTFADEENVQWEEATSFTDADIAAGHVRFVPDGGSAAPTFSISVSDYLSSSSVTSATVTFTPDPAIHWATTAGGSWRYAENWSSTPYVPGSDLADDVKIISPVGETVTLTGHDLTIGKLTVGADVTVAVVDDENLGLGSLDVSGPATNAGTISVGDNARANFYDTVNNSGTLIVTSAGGHFLFGGDVTNTGTVKATGGGQIYFLASLAGAVILNRGLIQFASAVGPQAIATFDDNSDYGFLSFASAQDYSGQITNFHPGNVIEFGGFNNATWHVEGQAVVVTYDTQICETPVSYSVTVGLSAAYSQEDFAIIPESNGGSELVFNNHWAPVEGSTDLLDPLNWSLGRVPDQTASVTYDSSTPAVLDLGGDVISVAGVFLGADADVTIVDGSLNIGVLDNSGRLTIGSIDGTNTQVALGQPLINHANAWMTVTGNNTGLHILTSFDNSGTFEANQGAQVTADGDVTNEASGTFNVLNGASFTLTGTFTNYGTALVDPATFTVIGDVHNFGTIEAGPDGVFHVTREVGGGQFLISGGSMEFGGKVDSNVTVSFGSGHDTLIIDQSLKFYGAISDFGIGDQILDHDGVVADSFTVDPTEGGVVLHYTENGNVVSLALSGDYSSNNFAVSYSGGGIDIAYNRPPTIAAPATSVTDEDTPLFFGDLDKIALADPDTGALTVTLSADHGAISLSHLDDLNFSNGHGTADHAMTFSGSTDAINHALDGLKFTPDANYDGNAAAITVAASDGVGAPIERVIDITINPVNDAAAIGAATSTGGLLSTGLTATAAGYLVASHDLINNLGDSQGHVTGFGENVLSGNDDGSTGAIDIRSVFGSAGINFFGDYYKFLYVNNNGDITFGGANATYTPGVITAGHFPIIAPFWADVDTRGGSTSSEGTGHSTGSNLVYYDLDSVNHVMTITWDDVGYYNGHTNLADAFQLQLIGTGDGDFDIVMRYESINWTAGDASGGHGGLGGTAARAGYSAGDGVAAHKYELPQSGDETGMLALDSTVGNSGIAGVDIFQVQSGNVSAAATISGAIAFSDPDSSDTHTATVQARSEGSIGTFALDDPNNNSRHVTEANGAGSVAWHFNLTSAETSNVLSNGAAMQSYDVTVADNHNTTATQAVSVSFGSNSADTFYFNPNMHLGADTILNFNPSADTIVLEGYNAIPDNGALSSNSYGDAVINLGSGDSITVAGVTQTDLHQHLDHVLTGGLA